MDGQGLLYTKLSHIQDRAAMLKVLQASQLGLHDVEDKFGIEEERATDFFTEWQSFPSNLDEYE